MANVIADLTGAEAPVANIAPAGAPIPALEDKPALPDVPEAPLRVLRGIKNGQIPGAVIPEGAPPGKSGLTPEGLVELGIDVYRPKTKGLAGVVFAPEHLSLKEVQHLDAKGKLQDVFPNIMSLLGEGAPNGSTGADNETVDSVSPSSQGTAPTPPQTVPVLPRPTFGSDAQARATSERVNAIQGEVPSKRPLPGAGKVLNGLFARAA